MPRSACIPPRGELRDPECFGGFAQIQRFDPEHPAVAAGAGAEDLHRRDVDVRLGKSLRDVGNGARPVFALDEKPLLLVLNLSPAVLAAFANVALSSGIRSNWFRRAPCGNAETPIRLTPASRRTAKMRAPSPGLSGTPA
jgi:hypothetical protein